MRCSVRRHCLPSPARLSIHASASAPSPTAPYSLLLRDADEIFISEIKAAGEYGKIGQAFAVLLPCRSVGVMGDARTYEKTLALRAVSTTVFMTADFYHLPFDLLARTEGIIPALETSHAVHAAVVLARTMRPDAMVVINVSGRGDKDVNEVIRLRGG